MQGLAKKHSFSGKKEWNLQEIRKIVISLQQIVRPKVSDDNATCTAMKGVARFLKKQNNSQETRWDWEKIVIFAMNNLKQGDSNI